MKTQDSNSQSALTPPEILEMLREGNARFRAGTPVSRDLMAQVDSTRGGQWPFAAVLGCIDSRVSPELVFDMGIGDIFSARIAGNFVNTDILGSLEFACAAAGAKVVVVLGHKRCGAVMGACDGVELGNLTAMLRKLEPAVSSVAEPADPAARGSSNPEFVQAVADANVDLTVKAMREQSDVLRGLEEEGKIAIVGAMYDIATGEVEFR